MMEDFDVELLYLELLENGVQINGNERENMFGELDDGKFYHIPAGKMAEIFRNRKGYFACNGQNQYMTVQCLTIAI